MRSIFFGKMQNKGKNFWTHSCSIADIIDKNVASFLFKRQANIVSPKQKGTCFQKIHILSYRETEHIPVLYMWLQTYNAYIIVTL